MKEIQVGEYVAIVDAEDYPFLSRFAWNIKHNRKKLYAQTNFFVSGKQIRVTMHRMITGMRNVMVDHRNGNSMDNRKENLRFATALQNSINRVRENSTGYRGVYKKGNSFSCQISVGNGKKIHRRGFKTAIDAAKEYDKLSLEIQGEFGIRNFPEVAK